MRVGPVLTESLASSMKIVRKSIVRKPPRKPVTIIRRIRITRSKLISNIKHTISIARHAVLCDSFLAALDALHLGRLQHFELALQGRELALDELVLGGLRLWAKGPPLVTRGLRSVAGARRTPAASRAMESILALLYRIARSCQKRRRMSPKERSSTCSPSLARPVLSRERLSGCRCRKTRQKRSDIQRATFAEASSLFRYLGC